MKKSKDGKRFGFVRFSNMMDVRKAISRLNGFVIMGNKLSVDLAKFKGRRQIWNKKSRIDDRVDMANNEKMVRKENEKSGGIVRMESGESSSKRPSSLKRTEKVNDEIEKPSIVVHGYVEEEQLWKLQICVVGVTTTCCDIKDVQERIVRGGLGEIIIRRIQGRFFLIEISDEELVGILK